MMFLRKRKFLALMALLVIGGLSAFTLMGRSAHEAVLSDSSASLDEATTERILENYGKLPLRFEENQGQSDDQVRFLARGKGYGLFLTDTEAVLSLRRVSDADQDASDVVRVQLVGSNANPEVMGQGVLPGKSNYLMGNDRSKWHTNVANYKKVAYKDVYGGIDLVYYGTESGELEHDFVVSPGVDPDQIRFVVKSSEGVRLDAQGNLLVGTEGGEVAFKAPVTYQEINGVRTSVESKYVFLASAEDAAQKVGFELGLYDRGHPVVIDPVLTYSTYLGGSINEEVRGFGVDGSGQAYFAGYAQSVNLPTTGGVLQPSHNPDAFDGFVSVLNSSGNALVYSTYLGGGATEDILDLTVNASGQAYVTGYTDSGDFPTTAGAYDQTHNGGGADAFASMLNSTGSGFVYSTFLGGSGSDAGAQIILDGSGNAYVTGNTASGNFPTAGTPYQGSHGGGGNDAFVSVVNSTGSGLVYSTYLGGNGADTGSGVALDGSGNIYVTGNTNSSNLPTTGSVFQPASGGNYDAYVTAFNMTTGLIYSTYLGGSDVDVGHKVEVDGSGNAYVLGFTKSGNFPTQSPYQPANGGGLQDAFVSVLNAAGTAQVYSTYLGGNGDDVGIEIALDSSGNAYVTGYTNSTNFPTYDMAHHGDYDAFLTVLKSTGNALHYTTYFGGSAVDHGTGIFVDGSGNVYLAGTTASANLTTLSAYDATANGGYDGYVAKFSGFNYNVIDVAIPDTVGTYASTVNVPVRISDATGLDVVAVELLVTYDRTIVTPGSPDRVDFGALTNVGWSIEDNVLVDGVGTTDTLSIALSTAADTLTGSGELVKLVMDVADIRSPASTPFELVSVLFNDGTPAVGTTTDGSLTVVGTDGSIDATPAVIIPTDVVTVTVTDADFDVDVGTADQVSATVVSETYGDTETVTLIETGVNTGVFTGTVNTAFSLVADPSENGVIGTVAGDSLFASYTDLLTGAGTTVVRQDTVEVIGGDDGEVLVTYVVQALDGRDGVRDTVRVQITDADLDTDVGLAEQVSATITNAISGEVEGVTLTETGVNTGVFQVRVPTIAGASGTNNDGELSLASWDTLDVSYQDVLTSQGGSAALQEITRVVNVFGDVRVNDQVQAFDAARLLAISVGLISANTQTTLVGDVDGNAAIQAFDASNVLQYVVRLIDRFGVQTDFVQDPDKNHPFEKPVPMHDVITLGELAVQGDGTYLLPVQLGERNGIVSGTLTLGMDAGVEVVDVSLGSGYGSFMIAHNVTKDGLKVAFAGSQSGLSGSGDVLLVRVRGVEGTPIRMRLDQVALNGEMLTPSVNIEAMEAVLDQASELVTRLHQNAPNPFNPQTSISYDLAQAGDVQLVIYSVTGQRVRTLVSEYQDVGSYQVVWDGTDAIGRAVGSGVYMMRMEAGTYQQVRRMVLLK